MSISEISSAFLGIGILALSALSQIALWQQKEYRLDRLRSHVRSRDGRLTNYPFVVAAIAALFVGWLLYLLPSFLPLLFLSTDLAGWAALLLFTAHHVWRVSHRGLFRPK